MSSLARFRPLLLAASLLLPTMVAQPSQADPAAQVGAVREIEVVVEGGYKPSRIEVREGERVRLKFVRKEYNSCTKDVVFPQLNIKRELPPNKAIVIDLPILSAGEYEFKCGMNMIRGTIVVTAHHH